MITFSKPGNYRTGMQLTPKQGEHIRSLIEAQTKISFQSYCEKVGLQVSNVYNYLSGRKALSFDTFARLMSGTDYEVECQVQFIIHSLPVGQTAKDAPSMSIEEELLSEELDQYGKATSSETESLSGPEDSP